MIVPFARAICEPGEDDWGALRSATAFRPAQKINYHECLQVLDTHSQKAAGVGDFGKRWVLKVSANFQKPAAFMPIPYAK
jgi:hypothetical protein